MPRYKAYRSKEAAPRPYPTESFIRSPTDSSRIEIQTRTCLCHNKTYRTYQDATACETKFGLWD